MLRFDNRVAVVTGAGGGLGRTYASKFAERGASVVVNDLGGSEFGEGRGSSMADIVVQEIRAKGGKAVANYDSVENGERIIKCAIDTYGRVDIVVNNAGILRDKSFVNMTDLDWDLIHRVHLKGSMIVTKAAWPHMRKQKYGRVIMTSSNSGIYGSFGQANYSAAKMGLIGLSNSLALEGAKYNIQVNALIPTAGSRLTQTVLPQEMIQALKPDYVMPLTIYLCHDSCQDTGGVFEGAAGWFGQLQWYRSSGKAFGRGKIPEPEQVRDNWEQIKDMNGAKHFSSSQEVSSQLAGLVLQTEGSPSRGQMETSIGATESGKPNPELAKSYKFDPQSYEYTSRDAIIYALGIGARAPNDLNLLWESDENFAVFPTFAVVPGLQAQGGLSSVPGLHVDMTRLLHGEQYLEVFRPFPAEGKVTSTARVADVLDKRSGAAVLLNVDTLDAQGRQLATGQYTIFLKGEGNFGGNKTSPAEKAPQPVPSRSPDSIVEQKTLTDQAVVYRQGSMDYNPLHIDPAFAQASGFKQPILHGLCSFGFAVRHVISQYAGGDVNKFLAVKARFSKPVIPGQTLVTEMWKEGDRVHFQTKVKETGDTVISGGYVQLKAGTSSANKPSTANISKSSDSLKSAAVFVEMEKRLKSQPETVKKVQAIFQWNITQSGKHAGTWTVDLKTGSGEIYQGEPKNDAKPGVTLTLDDENMVGLVTGKLNPQQAFMSGKLKIKGNIMLTQKLQGLLKDQSKL